MMRKSVAIILGLAVLSAPDLATAGQRDNSFYDKAKVVKVKPIYRKNAVYYPREQCWNEPVYRRQRDEDYDYMPTITGAIIGGVIGNQFGKGNGRDAMTLAGALLGGAVGHSIGNERYRGGYTTTERRCEYRDDNRRHKQLMGYRVKYRYQGKVFHTRTREHPGRWIPVRVTVDPRDGRANHSWLPDADFSDSDESFWYQEEPKREVWW
jgi:uncharacterized protein YcfJ